MVRKKKQKNKAASFLVIFCTLFFMRFHPIDRFPNISWWWVGVRSIRFTCFAFIFFFLFFVECILALNTFEGHLKWRLENTPKHSIEMCVIPWGTPWVVVLGLMIFVRSIFWVTNLRAFWILLYEKFNLDRWALGWLNVCVQSTSLWFLLVQVKAKTFYYKLLILNAVYPQILYEPSRIQDLWLCFSLPLTFLFYDLVT